MESTTDCDLQGFSPYAVTESGRTGSCCYRTEMIVDELKGMEIHSISITSEGLKGPAQPYEEGS